MREILGSHELHFAILPVLALGGGLESPMLLAGKANRMHENCIWDQCFFEEPDYTNRRQEHGTRKRT
jgi:hypothetical protein